MSPSLRQNIRRGSLKTPVQQGFVLQEWDDALEALPSPSSDDLHLHSSAVFVGQQLEGLRTQLRQHPIPRGQPEALVRRSVGIVNRECLKAYDSSKQRLKPPLKWVHSIAEAEIELHGSLNKTTVADLTETAIDGLRFELAAVTSSDISFEDLNSERGIGRLALRANLSIFYHILEEQWLDMLHHGWSVESTGHARTIAPHLDTTGAVDRATAQYREDQLDLELVLRSVDFVKAISREGTLPAIGRGDGTGSYRAIETPPRDLHTVLLGRIHAMERDLAGVVDSIIEKSTRLTAADMLTVWGALVPLANEIVTRTPLHQSISSLDQVEQFAPLQDAKALARTLYQVTGLSLAKCHAAIKQLTWRSVRDSLWHRPFVSVDGGKRFVIVLSALLSTNLRRSIEYWVQQNESSITLRGQLFEQFVRDDLADSLRSNQLLRTAQVPRVSIEPPDRDVGDIDLLVVVANAVLVGEVKCLLRPGSSHECFQHSDRLSEAVDQVGRKAAWIRRNLPWLVDKYGLCIPADTHVHPCVVVNSPSMALRVIDEVPVVDQYILHRYFGDGYGVTWSRLGEEETAPRVQFYSDDASAAANLSRYLCWPPHLRMYRDSVAYSAMFQPDFVDEHGTIVALYPKIRMTPPDAGDAKNNG